jgi:hypothetical protein
VATIAVDVAVALMAVAPGRAVLLDWGVEALEQLEMMVKDSSRVMIDARFGIGNLKILVYHRAAAQRRGSRPLRKLKQRDAQGVGKA